MSFCKDLEAMAKDATPPPIENKRDQAMQDSLTEDLESIIDRQKMEYVLEIEDGN